MMFYQLLAKLVWYIIISQHVGNYDIHTSIGISCGEVQLKGNLTVAACRVV